MLNVRDVSQKAAKAKDKKAPIGTDITIDWRDEYTKTIEAADRGGDLEYKFMFD